MNDITNNNNTDLAGGFANEIIYKKILSITKNLHGRTLDLGAGRGGLSVRLFEQGGKEIFACDKYANFEINGIKFIICDFNKYLPYEDNFFDLVVCCEVIEHLENPRLVMREISRVLKPGGTLVLSTPNNLSLRSRLSLLLKGYFAYFSYRDYPAHITALVKQDLMRMIKESGMHLLNIEFTDWGLMPKLRLHWQCIFPFLRSELFSDNIVLICKK